MKATISTARFIQILGVLCCFSIAGCSYHVATPDFNGAKDQYTQKLRAAFDEASERFDVTVDTESLVTSTHSNGYIAVATIPSTSIADALIYFSFPSSACGSNALRPGFYLIESVKDENTGKLIGVRHFDKRGREVVTIPLDKTISHTHHHTTGSKIVTGSNQSPTAAASVFAWFNTGDGNTHIEYDLTNGQCCPLPGC